MYPVISRHWWPVGLGYSAADCQHNSNTQAGVTWIIFDPDLVPNRINHKIGRSPYVL